MKVIMSAAAKKVVTVDELEAAKSVIESMKEDTSTVEEYAAMALHAAGAAVVVEVFKATAEISKNRRAWDSYCDNSGMLDVWVDATADTVNHSGKHEFVKIGAYLTDIWQITAENAAEVAEKMYIRRFAEVVPA